MTSKRLNATLSDYDLSEAVCHSLCTYQTFHQNLSHSLFLPDTVIFRGGKPIAWYCTDLNGALREKKDFELGINSILSSFLEDKQDHGIVACLLSPTKRFGQENSNEKGKGISVEYFDEEELRGFLKNVTGHEKAILQKFVNPEGENNNSIEAVWAKDKCLLNKKVNCQSLKDQHVGVNQKCMTYEGPDSLCATVQIEDSELAIMINSLMQAIVEHLSKTLFLNYELSKLVSYFKIGEDNQLWYLRTTSVSVSQVSKTTLKDQSINQPNSTDSTSNTKLKTANNDNIKNQLKLCTNCDKNFAVAQMINMTYKALTEKARNFLDAPSEYYNRHNIKSARQTVISARPKLQTEEMRKNNMSEMSGDLLQSLKLIHPSMQLESLTKLIQDPLFLSKKAHMCYGCYMCLFNVSPRMQNPSSFRKTKEQTKVSKSQRLSATFVLKTLNKSGEASNFASSLHLKRNFSSERSESAERIKSIQRKDSQSIQSSRSQEKVRKEPNFYIKPSTHRRQQISSMLYNKSASKSTGTFVLTTERSESFDRNSLYFTKQTNSPNVKAEQSSIMRDDNLSPQHNESRSFVKVQKIRLTSHDSRMQNNSEIESTADFYNSVSYEKLPISKSEALMKQLKQVSGFQPQVRVSERSTAEGSKDICGTSSENLSVLQKNSSVAGEGHNSSKKRIGIVLKRNKETSGNESLSMTRKNVDDISYSKVLSAEETVKLRNEIKQMISSKERSPNSKQMATKNIRLSVGGITSGVSVNSKKTDNQSSRNRRISSLSVKPQVAQEVKVKNISGENEFTNDNYQKEAKPSDFSETAESTFANGQSKSISSFKLEGKCRGKIEEKEKKENQHELIDSTYNICNDINRGIDFIKNKAFTRNTSWLAKKNDSALRQHKKSSSISILASNSQHSLRDGPTQDKVSHPIHRASNTSLKPTNISVTGLNIQKIYLTDATNEKAASPIISPKKETSFSKSKDLKIQSPVLHDHLPQAKEAFLEEFAISPSTDGVLSERFEACLLEKEMNTLNMSESEEGLDKAFVVGEDDPDTGLDRNRAMFSPLLEDSDVKSTQKVDTRNNLEDKANLMRGMSSESFSSREAFNNKKKLCILRKTNTCGRSGVKEKKVSWKEEVEEISIEQIKNSEAATEEQEDGIRVENQRLATDFSDDSQEVEEMEEWQQDDVERYFENKMPSSEILDFQKQGVIKIARVIME